MSLKVIITGCTGMVGEGVLHVCLQSSAVESILIVGRRPYGLQHPKLSEKLITGFDQVESISSDLKGYDACFFCAGVTSVGKSEAEYTTLTHDLTLQFARIFLAQNPHSLFHYISGKGTDSAENSRMMWARVKGRTENHLLSLGFREAYMYRPGFIKPIKGLKNTLKAYTYIGFLFPILLWLTPNAVVTLREIGLAMINTSLKGYDKKVLECADIRKVAATDNRFD
jgi:uncharacterized protein YbjT (DUF2867 family)